MVDIFSVVLVGSVVTYFMYQNINKVTESIDLKTKDNSPRYAMFSAKIQEYIRALKKDLDEDVESSNPRFFRNEKCDDKSDNNKFFHFAILHLRKILYRRSR